MIKIITPIALVIWFQVSLAVIGDRMYAFPTPGGSPIGLATDGTHLYLSDRKTDSIYCLSMDSGTVVSSFPAPGLRLSGLAFDGSFIWAVDAEEKVIIKLDPSTQMSLKTVYCPASDPGGLAFDGNYLWLGDLQTGKLMQLSTEDGTTIKEMLAPSQSPTGLAWDGRYLWVADRITDFIYLVWPATGEVVLMFKAPGKYAVGLASVGDRLYCADYQADSIFVLKADDEEYLRLSDPVFERLEYMHQFRNYGPGKVISLDIYLALPEESARQKLILPPLFDSTKVSLLVDHWGQKIGRWHFDSLSAGEVVAASYITLAELLDQWFVFRPERVGPLKEIPNEIKKQYLADDSKYSIHSTVITEAVKKAVGTESNPYWIMRKVLRYIINNIEYELAGGWNIAPTVLEMGKGSCSEYSFVFIAMCRAAGLPARYVGSIAQRGDLAGEDDVFHRWCEVYLPRIGWVPVDPSAADQTSPHGQANCIGHVANRYLITTTGGGNSEYLGWEYNSFEKYQSKGVCKIYSEKLGEWSPVSAEKAAEYEKSAPEFCRPR